MGSDKQAIARLERKIDNNRQDVHTWISVVTLLLPVLAFASGADPLTSLLFVIASAAGLVVMVFHRASLDRQEARAAAEENQQALARSISGFSENRQPRTQGGS